MCWKAVSPLKAGITERGSHDVKIVGGYSIFGLKSSLGTAIKVIAKGKVILNKMGALCVASFLKTTL